MCPLELGGCVYVTGGYGLSQGLSSAPPLSPGWRLTHFLHFCEGKSLGCLPSPPYTPERRSQLDSSAKCPDFSPHPCLSHGQPLSPPTGHAGELQCQAGVLGVTGALASSPWGGAQPDSALPTLSFTVSLFVVQPGAGTQRVRVIGAWC